MDINLSLDTFAIIEAAEIEGIFLSPLSGSILAHFFTKDEKITFFKSIGIILGFFGIVFLFFDKLIINESNYFHVLIIILGSTF